MALYSTSTANLASDFGTRRVIAVQEGGSSFPRQEIDKVLILLYLWQSNINLPSELHGVIF